MLTDVQLAQRAVSALPLHRNDAFDEVGVFSFVSEGAAPGEYTKEF